MKDKENDNMSKMSELSQVLDDLISCGEKMIQTANVLRECFTSDDAPAAKPEKKEEPAKKEEPSESSDSSSSSSENSSSVSDN